MTFGDIGSYAILNPRDVPYPPKIFKDPLETPCIYIYMCVCALYLVEFCLTDAIYCTVYYYLRVCIFYMWKKSLGSYTLPRIMLRKILKELMNTFCCRNQKVDTGSLKFKNRLF